MNQLAEKFGPNLPLLFESPKFGQLILRKIIEIVATRCQILSLKCTKFNFGAGGAYSAPPDPLAGFKGPTSKGREGREGKGGKGVGEWRGMGWEGRKRRGGWEGGGRGREGKGERMWRAPESGLPRGPCWLSAGLVISHPRSASIIQFHKLLIHYEKMVVHHP